MFSYTSSHSGGNLTGMQAMIWGIANIKLMIAVVNKYRAVSRDTLNTNIAQHIMEIIEAIMMSQR